MGRFCAVYSIYNEEEYIEANIRNLYPEVDRILVLMNTEPWVGAPEDFPPDKTLKIVQEISDPDGKIEIHQGGWQDATHGGQLAQRTHGISLLDEGDWYWLVDGDEFTSPECIRRMREHTERSTADCLQVYFYTLWQTFHWVGWCECVPRIYRVREGAHFVAPCTVANAEGQKYETARIPQDEVYTLHAGYVRSDRRMWEKMEIYGRRSKRGDFYSFEPRKWWETKWVAWRMAEEWSGGSVHPVPEYRGAAHAENGPQRLPLEVAIPRALADHPYYFEPRGGRVSLVIVTYNSSAMLREMLRTLEATVDPQRTPLQFVWVDNGSRDVLESYSLMLESQGRMGEEHMPLESVRNTENLFFTKAVNQGLELCAGRYILLVNPDCEFRVEGWLERMIKDLDGVHNGGICGCKMLHRDGTIHHGGGFIQGENFLHIGRNEPDCGQCDELRTVDWVTGACLLFKREVLIALGPLDERHKHFKSDNQYCLAAWEAGFQVVYSPAEIVHDAGKSVQRVWKPSEILTQKL